MYELWVSSVDARPEKIPITSQLMEQCNAHNALDSQPVY